MRTPKDICLLCQERHSINTKSHIVPRFISKSIFLRGGFILDTGNAHKPPTPVQDSAVEDYILCVECEKYFEFIETYIASRIQRRLWDVSRANEFTDTDNGNGIRRKECLNVNPWLFRLFIYSIIWRCSISNTRAHIDFKLSADENEFLRKNLMSSFSQTHKELMAKIETSYKEISIVPFIFVTSEEFTDTTRNVIASSPLSQNPYYLQLNEYFLVISFHTLQFMNGFEFLINDRDENIKIGFLKEEGWLKINSDFIDMFAKLATQRTLEKGLKPFLRPE